MKSISLMLVALFVISCSSSGRWEGTDELVSRLSCGLSPEQVSEICDDFDGVTVTKDKLGPPGNLVARKAGTSLILSFQDGTLAGYEVTWADGFMYVNSQPYVELCPDKSQEIQ